jgi:hypothetical protein
VDFARVLHQVSRALAEREIPFALAGGVAVAAHGVTRGTQDLDVVVPMSRADEAVAALSALGFETLRRSLGFSSHLRPAHLERVDLLFVEGATSEALFARAGTQTLFDVEAVPVVHPEHLVAMKLFALKQNPTRLGIDLEDVRALMLKGLVDANTVVHYLERYGLVEFTRALGIER